MVKISKKSIGILIVLFFAICILYTTVGVGISMLILAIIFLIQAILFSVRTEYYESYVKFMSPVYYKIYSEKGDEFIRKKRKTNIISYYLLSVTFIFNGVMQIKLMSNHLYNVKEYLIMGVFIIPIVILISYICNVITRKSKTANEDLMWNLILGVGITIIIFAIMGVYIFNTIQFEMK